MCQTTTPMARLPFRAFRTIAVSGNSMSPTYNDGDWLLLKSIVRVDAKRASAFIGKVVLIERESYPGILLIKRVKRVDGNQIWVEGDNSDASTDSRDWGAITPEEIVGRVLIRYRWKRHPRN